MRRVWSLLAVLLLGFVLLAAPHADAQTTTAETGRSGFWDLIGNEAEALLAAPAPPNAELEAIRKQINLVRTEAFAQQTDAQAEADELNARLEALGPAPEEGVVEPAEIATRRADLEAQYRRAMVPVLQAQEAQQRASALISEIDRRLLEQISRVMLTRGPIPLFPSNWSITLSELSQHTREFATELVANLRNSIDTENLLSRLPVNILLGLTGVVIIVLNRIYLMGQIEVWLGRANNPRTVAWVLFLRNVSRIVIPMIAVGIIFSALNPNTLLEQGSFSEFFSIPDFVWYLIGAGWISGSFFAPKTGAFRPVPLSDREARVGGRMAYVVGTLLAADSLTLQLTQKWDLYGTAAAVMFFPLALVTSACLWRLARLIRVIRVRSEEMATAGAGGESPRLLGQQLLKLLSALALVGCVIVPVLSMTGYANAARYIAGSLLMTYGIIGASVVLFDLLNKTASLIFADPGRDDTTEGGFGPVIVGTIVILGAIHVLGLTWGARPEDIIEAWRFLRQGVTVGGVRISATGVLKFIFVFGLLMAGTRLLQTVLRSIVLPRTRLDAGGRNAVLAGTGYGGVSLALLAGVSAAGFDLTSLAIVAGALSVGIGFGLQTIVSNFVSGIILLIERPIKEGDWIEVAGFAGYVKGIHVRSTEISTFDHASVIVPNSDLIAGTVLNRTHSDMSGRVAIPIGVGYGSDPRHVERVLMGIIENHPLVLRDPGPSVLFMGFGADSMDLEVRCYLRDVNFSLTVKSDVNFDIVKQFAKEGIEIPFAQRDLHIRSIEGLDKMLGAMKKDDGHS